MGLKSFLLNKYLIDWNDKSSKIKVIVTVLSSIISTMAIILVIGSINGFQHIIKDKVHNFYPELGISNYNMPVQDYENTMKNLKKLDYIRHAEPTIYSELIIASFNNDSSPKSLSGCMFRAVDEKEIEDAFRTLRERGFRLRKYSGSISGRLPVFLGSELAKKLMINLGDSISLYIPFFRTTVVGTTHKAQEAYLAGIIDTGLFRYNEMAGFMLIGDMQELLELKNEILAIDIYLKKNADTDAAKNQIKVLTDAHVRDFTFISHGITGFYRLIKKGLYFLLFIIMGVGLFNIISMIVLMILEKLKEFSVLNVLGMPLKSIAFLVCSKGFLIGVFSSFAGLLLSIFIAYAENRLQIIRIEQSVYDIDYLPVYIEFYETALIMAIIILLNTLIPLLPGLRILKLHPSEILRYE